VLAQAYDNWELVLVDDGSTVTELLGMLPRVTARDQRITSAKLGKHEGISAASNHGLHLPVGSGSLFLIMMTFSSPMRFFHVVRLLQKYPEADLIYSDEDKLGDNGFEAPVFKPDWSPIFSVL